MTIIPPPRPVILDHPGVVRFAVGSEGGPRSHSWRVEGVSNASGHDDIYVGTRQTMKDVKISLHDAKPPRYPKPSTVLAFGGPYAVKNALENKLLACMQQTAPLARGWRHELTIATPTSTFGTFAETPHLKRGEVIQWWTPPERPWQLSFHLYVGDADSPIVTLDNHVGDVCQMQLTHGRRLWIVAQCEPMADSVDQAIRQHVASLPADPRLVHPFTLRKEGDGVPVLLDLAVTYRSGDD